jgi:organic radical activating enzyme
MKGRIAEIFESIQGEGIYQGIRQIFLRLVGCIQRCNFCICENTNIILSNETEKKIENLEKDDELLAFDEIKKIPTNTIINKIFQGETQELYELELEDGNNIRITGEHLIFTQKGWIKIKDLQITDEVLTVER